MQKAHIEATYTKVPSEDLQKDLTETKAKLNAQSTKNRDILTKFSEFQKQILDKLDQDNSQATKQLSRFALDQECKRSLDKIAAEMLKLKSQSNHSQLKSSDCDNFSDFGSKRAKTPSEGVSEVDFL